MPQPAPITPLPASDAASLPGPRLSFVIPAHDEEVLIAATVDAVHEALVPLGVSYEVIVAADGCTDDTASIAARHGAIVVAHDRRQIAATRNLGARAASGEVLVFVDADTRVNRQTIADMLALLDAGAVGGGAMF